MSNKIVTDPTASTLAASAEATPTPAALSDHLLRRDVRMLGFELGRVIKHHGSDQIFNLVEEIRYLAKQRRAGDENAEKALRDRIAGLNVEQLEGLIRALSCFFDLANLAEDRHRIRVLRHRERVQYPAPRRESIGAAVETLHAQGLSAEQVQHLLNQLAIEMVFTAHPTEAKRRTVRNTLRRLRLDVTELDNADLLPREREYLLSRIKSDLGCLWETDALRPHKPTVLEEVRRSLFAAESVWEVLPWLYRGMRLALSRVYPGHQFELPTFLQFGTWIGGDRDGNPFVTAEVTKQSLAILRNAALKKHLQQCAKLNSIITISQEHHPLSPELSAALEQAKQRWPIARERTENVSENEAYRQWLAVIRVRLEQTAQADPFAPLPELAYAGPAELAKDLELIAASLRLNGHEDLTAGELQDWLDRTAVFGFHLTRMDIREDSSRLHDTIAELTSKLGIASDYDQFDEAAKQKLLTDELAADVQKKLASSEFADQLSELTRETFQLFVLLRRTLATFGSEALGTFVISMTRQPSDTLAVLWLSRVAQAHCNDDAQVTMLPISPLFETIDDLSRAGATLDTLLNMPEYREHVRATGDTQVCMVGYSDSTKDGGNLAANWALYQGESDLARVSATHSVKLMLFHGRGGALGRGGGPAARGILSLPPQAVRGKLRMTEQGEVLAERYDDPQIAYRHLEQVSWATLLVSGNEDETPDPVWTKAFSTAAEASMHRYRQLLADPAFVQYFGQATPIDTIETMPIGSRPSRRRGERKLENLRAIPYTFAWTQSRHMITAFFGLGTGLREVAGGDWSTFKQMYEAWPFFRAVIDNAELALAKSDMSIAREYASLLSDREAGIRIWSTINEEYSRSRDAVLAITGRDELIADTPWLQRSIRVRNPYIDPLNFIQGSLMQRLSSTELPAKEQEELQDLLRLSVQGISSGMRTTG